MTMDEVLAFLHRILVCAQDDAQAQMMLRQFEQIISARAKEDENMREAVKLINQLKYSSMEAAEIARTKYTLTLEDMQIAKTRYAERMVRESRYNRC